MDLKIHGKTALVLGASQGLGAAIAEALAAEGANLVIAARNKEALDSNAKRLSDTYGVNVSTQVVDLANPESVAIFCRRIRADIQPDILVANSGGPSPSKALGVAPEIWLRSAQVLLFSVIQITEAAIEGMRERNWGRVLAIGSSGVVQPIPDLAISNTIRSAAAAFFKTLSAEVGKDGVTVNMILPGKIDTSRVQSLDAARANREGKTEAQVRKEFEATVPANRYGRPEEFSAVAVFLLSEPASYVTGQITRVDGGLVKAM